MAFMMEKNGINSFLVLVDKNIIQIFIWGKNVGNVITEALPVYGYEYLYVYLSVCLYIKISQQNISLYIPMECPTMKYSIKQIQVVYIYVEWNYHSLAHQAFAIDINLDCQPAVRSTKLTFLSLWF